ncbi:SRPBCC family protein [Rhodococcus sp. NPDC127528]|uniref:SRPBCC family protein n=1 Tax=unclassified Rhodococcus (in: high G+C Gram-positive bacteria) TaxID=192944 RepID=UPI003640ED3A
MTNTLEASIEIDATPEAVWTLVSDLARMGRWSPQCKKMVIFGGDVKRGTRTFNINKKGLLVWPTSAKVIRFEPNTAIAWRVVENHTIWTYELEPTATGTKVTERREAPTGTTKVSALLIDKFMGGTADFEVDMIAGMNTTLARIKSEVEAATAATR